MTTKRETYWSMQEFADACESRYRQDIDDLTTRDDWRGGSLPELVQYGRFGWTAEMPDALSVAEDAVKVIEKDHELTSFRQEWDVTGSTVDIPAYLAGQPECMIE